MPPGATEAEEINDAMIENIPDDDGDEASRGAPAAAPNVHTVLEALRRDVERAFAGELTRVEKSFGSYVADLQHRLTDAEAQLARLSSERARLAEENAAHERKWKAVRDLAGNAGR